MQYIAAASTLNMTMWHDLSHLHILALDKCKKKNVILIAFVLDLNILIIWKVFTLHVENISSCVYILKQEDTKVTWNIFWDSTYGHWYIAWNMHYICMCNKITALSFCGNEKTIRRVWTTDWLGKKHNHSQEIGI